MTYREHETLPEWEQIIPDAGGMPGPAREGKLRWGGKSAPPDIGKSITVTMNGCGPAIVTGYFEEDGFLGIRCRLTAPPDWHVRQNNGDPTGHVFGPEFTIET